MRKIKNILTSLFGSNQGRVNNIHYPTSADTLSGDKVYFPKPIRPLFPKPVTPYQLEIKMHALTESPIWDWECFRNILICLATMGEGRYIPATRRPNCVFLNGLQTTFMELRQISVQSQGRETSRVVFVDRERSCLVISGKTHIGTTKKVKINMVPEQGREMVQLPILTIHVHPIQGGSDGLSDLDYVSFLSDQRQIVMMICFQGGILFAMKTSATSKTIAPDTAQRLISITRNDIMTIWSKLNLPKSILAFNKAICTEFGMTLYQTTDQNENVARRVEVTNI